ncbi:MAG: hypothetical protein MHM6MM_001145 [Cercozoa sp. M6MM]
MSPIWARVRFYLHMVWWFLCCAFDRVFEKLIKSARLRVLIFGDGIAAGFGDYCTLADAGGLSKRVRPFLQQDIRKGVLRTAVDFSQRGKLMRKIADFDVTDEAALSHSIGANIDKFDVAVLVCGSFDALHFARLTDADLNEEVGKTMTKLVRMRELLRGKLQVCLLPCPSSFPKAAHEFTKQLQSAIHREKFVIASDVSERLSASNYFVDAVHLSSSGYKLLGADMVSSLRTALKKAEWKYLSGKMGLLRAADAKKD